jgi:hypothetical protein
VKGVGMVGDREILLFLFNILEEVLAGTYTSNPTEIITSV